MLDITIPDWLALARVILVPIIMSLTIGGGDEALWLAGGLFAVAATTDFLDGYLARRWNTASTLGAFLDTTADKLLVTGSLMALIAIDRVSIWAALVIVMREFIVMALRGLVALGGGTVKPSTWGKVKATSQFVAIGFAFVRIGPPIGGLHLDQWLMLVAVALTVVSASQYLAGFWETVRRSRSGAVT